MSRQSFSLYVLWVGGATVVFPRQLECQRTLYFIEPSGFLAPTLYQASSSSEVSWDRASRPVTWPICPRPWLARPAKHQLVSLDVKALLRAPHVVQHVPSQFAFTPKDIGAIVSPCAMALMSLDRRDALHLRHLVEYGASVHVVTRRPIPPFPPSARRWPYGKSGHRY